MKKDNCFPDFFKKYLVFIFSLFCFTGYSQFTFYHQYDVNGQNSAARETSNGEYIIYGTNSPDLSLIKTNNQGVPIWSKKIGTPLGSRSSCIQQTSDGGFIMVGTIETTGTNKDVYLIKTDNNGALEWSKSFGGLLNEIGCWVEQTADGGYIVSGSANIADAWGYYGDVYLIKTNNIGGLVWDKTFALPSGKAAGQNVKQTSDGGYIITGNDNEETSGNAFLIRTDGLGTILWKYIYEMSCTSGVISSGREVWELPGGNFIVGGFVGGEVNPSFSFFLKVFSNGTVDMVKAYKSLNPWEYIGFNSFDVTSDGGFVGTGGGYEAGMILYLVKADANLNLLWSRVYSIGVNSPNSIRQSMDLGFSLIEANTILKTDQHGLINCLTPGALVEDVASAIPQVLNVVVNSINAELVPNTIVTPVVISSSPICTPISTSITATPVSCNGENDGTATVNPVSGTAPYTYAWMPGGANTASVSGLSAGTYTVTVTDDSNSITIDSVTITEPPEITMSVSGNIIICNGSSIFLTADALGGSGGFQYIWQPENLIGSSVLVSPDTSTSFVVTASDSNGCTAIDSVDVQVVSCCANPPVLSILTNQVSCNGICDGSASITLNALTGTPPYQYNTNPGNLNSLSLSNLCPGQYQSIIVDLNNCKDTVTFNITEPPPLAPQYSIDLTDGCAPLCVNMVNLTPNSATASWQLGAASSQNGNNINHCFNNSGTYTVILTVTDNAGCTGQVTLNTPVTVQTRPMADFITIPDEPTILNSFLNFIDNSVNASLWNWSFGDLHDNFSIEQNPIFEYPSDTGTYIVQLIISNEFGCLDTTTKEIHIKAGYQVFVPNAFTPNGDGINDLFSPKGVGISTDDFKLMIFDRWGDLIFETSELNLGWDGRANGGKYIAQRDVYVWKLHTKDYFENRYENIGHITLVR